MPYQDSNPERRNLMVLSMSIIIFTLGKAEIVDGKLTLPLINVVLRDPSELIVVLWLSLGWLIVQYFNVHHHGWTKGREDDLEATRREAIARLIKDGRAIGIGDVHTRPFLVLKKDRVILYPSYTNREIRAEREQMTLPLTAPEFDKIYRTAAFKAVIGRPSTLGYVVPYVVGLAAAILLII